MVLAVSLVGLGCVKGLMPIGWSGGAVSDGTLFVGSKEGRLVAINLDDESRLWAESLRPVSQPGFLGCSPVMGGGCGGAAGVAIYGTPVIYGELVYIAGYNGKIYAYNTEGLALRWVYPRESNLEPFVGGLVAAEGKLRVMRNRGEASLCYNCRAAKLSSEIRHLVDFHGLSQNYMIGMCVGELDERGLLPETQKLAFYASDGFTTDLTLDVLLGSSYQIVEMILVNVSDKQQVDNPRIFSSFDLVSASGLPTL